MLDTNTEPRYYDEISEATYNYEDRKKPLSWILFFTAYIRALYKLAPLNDSMPIETRYTMSKQGTKIDNLPDEVILLILEKIDDPKYLIISSLISKSIASILSHRKSLLIRFPPLTSPPPSWNIRFSDDMFPRLTNLLHRFGGIESLRLEVPCICRDSEDIDELSTDFKWKAKIGCQIETLSYISMHLAGNSDHSPTNDHMPEGEQVEEEDEDYDGDNLVRRSYHEIFGPKRMATSMFDLILLLIAHHPNLRSIDIMDSENHGGLAVKDEIVSSIRIALSKDSLTNMLYASCKFTHFMVWYKTKLNLKLSGIEIGDARLVIYTHKKIIDQEDDSDDTFMNPSPNDLEIDAAIPGEFEHDQDKVFGEAMAQLLAQHEIKAIVGPI